MADSRRFAQAAVITRHHLVTRIVRVVGTKELSSFTAYERATARCCSRLDDDLKVVGILSMANFIEALEEQKKLRSQEP